MIIKTPALPEIGGKGVDLTDLTLSLYAKHPASDTTEYSRARLAQLGKSALYLVVTEYLFHKTNHLDGREIQEERDATIKEETLLSWLDCYPMEKQRFLREQLPTDSLSERKNLYEFFLSYVGAVYLSNGRSTRPALENWIIRLMLPSEIDTIVDEGDVSSAPSSPKLPDYAPPFKDSLSTPPHTPLRVTPPQQSFTQPSLGSPVASPSSNASNILATGMVALLNQTANQKHVSCVYETRHEGEAHDPLWITRCLIDGQEKGCGQGSTKKIAQYQAAQQALLQMRWISE